MTKPVYELVTVAGRSQLFPGDCVRLAPRHCGTDLGECTALSAQHGIVSVDELRWRLAQADGAGQVGRIPPHHGAHVDHHWLAFLNRTITRVVMWTRAMRSGGHDDRETRSFRAK